ncbi:MAG: hypothetical protein ACYS32_05560, partial [Planctomycetota bacterium]
TSVRLRLADVSGVLAQNFALKWNRLIRFKRFATEDTEIKRNKGKERRTFNVECSIWNRSLRDKFTGWETAVRSKSKAARDASIVTAY